MTAPLQPGAPPAALGTSLALADGDLVWTGRDLALVSGRENFAQALGVMIGTPFGSDPVNVGYGFDATAVFATANTVRAAKDVIRLNLIKSLSADARVQAIGDIVFDDDPDFARLAPELAGRRRGSARARAWHAVATFTTVQGEQQRVAMAGGLP